jgi:eukaryotic-like serine/threonine-protein kinase
MSVGNDAFSDPRFATLDAPGVVELCNSLADYGEAGGLSRELMLQVGSFAEARFTDDLEVLLAVARMYLLGGETARARATLVRAGKRWPDESRVRPLLAHALRLLDDHRSVDEVLRDSRVSMRPSAPPRERRPSTHPQPVARPAERRVPPRAATPPGLPVVKVREPASSTPLADAARARSLDAPLDDPYVRSHSDAIAPTPASGMPIVPRAPAVPRGMGLRTPPHTPTVPRMRAAVTPAATARVHVDEAMIRAAAEVRTEIARRAVRESEVPPEPTPTPRSQRELGSAPRTTRIRLLDPDDARRRLDPYELIGELASGGMATVFLGRLAGAGGFQRFVAIKRLHPHLEREEQFVKMFLDEGRLAAGIHHPHVVPILEVGMSNAGYYLVMEFIEGDTLAGLIVRALQRGKPMPPDVAARIVLDSLAGLHAAHQLTDGDGQYLGLVHRDCTPQNILVGIDGSARVTDFGVARAASRLAYTQPQQVKGKVAYLSPEQAHATELDRRSDLFTMGIVLWEALAGRPLFQGETEAATLSRLMAGKVPPLQSFAPDVPAAVDEVCRRALAQDRNRRYRTAAEMAEALERAMSAEGFGGAASPRDLGRYVEHVMGAEIAAQRELVRNWLAQHEAGPMSRAPRSAASTAVRSPVTPRAVPPPSVPPIPRAPVSDEAPETPAPKGEKHPRLSVPASPPAPRVETSEVHGSPDEPTVEASEPTAEEVEAPALPARETSEDPPAAEVHEEHAEPNEAGEAPQEEATQEEPAPPEGLVDRVMARMPAWFVRLASLKLSTRQGTLMVIVIVVLAVSPLVYKVAKQRLSPLPAASAQRVKRAMPPPRPKPTGAWDEGVWPLPDAGARSPDE